MFPRTEKEYVGSDWEGLLKWLRAEIGQPIYVMFKKLAADEDEIKDTCIEADDCDEDCVKDDSGP